MPAITYDWWRNFLQFLLDNQAYTWFGKAITFGELAVGLGLICRRAGGPCGGGGHLDEHVVDALRVHEQQSDPADPGLGYILAWKVAGWMGVDRYLLPMLGTPWQRGSAAEPQRTTERGAAAPDRLRRTGRSQPTQRRRSRRGHLLSVVPAARERAAGAGAGYRGARGRCGRGGRGRRR